MSTPPLNFEKAIYGGDAPAIDQCAYCGRGITTAYFRVGDHMACPVCAKKAQSLVPPDSHKVFVHALTYGVGAAAVACAAYATLTIATGLSIGYAAIGVGYLVGWAMRRAAKGHGGWRYQWAAVLLTYAAVAVAFVPIAIHANSQRKAAAVKVIRQAPAPADTTGKPAARPKPARAGWASSLLSILVLLGIGLISTFLVLTASFAHGVLNLFIIFIRCRFAWQMMAVKTVSVDGPFDAVPQRPEHVA